MLIEQGGKIVSLFGPTYLWNLLKISTLLAHLALLIYLAPESNCNGNLCHNCLIQLIKIESKNLTSLNKYEGTNQVDHSVWYRSIKVRNVSRITLWNGIGLYQESLKGIVKACLKSIRYTKHILASLKQQDWHNF